MRLPTGEIVIVDPDRLSRYKHMGRNVDTLGKSAAKMLRHRTPKGGEDIFVDEILRPDAMGGGYH
jgi:hypothetical protein